MERRQGPAFAVAISASRGNWRLPNPSLRERRQSGVRL